MQVILFQNIEKLGMQGDVVNVANGYYRNFLGPRGIAIEATQGNLKRLEIKRKRLQEEAARQINAAEGVAEQLRKIELVFVMRANEEKRLFGSIQDHDIYEKLVELGFSNLERRQIALAEPIKTLGKHKVKVRLHSHVAADIKVTIQPEGQDEAAEAEAAPEAAPAEDTPSES